MNTNSKIVAIFGCKTTTRFLMEVIRSKYPVSFLVTIGSTLGMQNDVADYTELRDYAKSKGIEIYEAKSYSLKDPIDQLEINNFGVDIAFVIGWQRLIPSAILEKLSVGAFGMHGSSMNLPMGRGRSPMNWSLIEGRHSFYTNLFKYDSGVDSGDIVDTFKFQITDRDTAETMHFKNTLAMAHLVVRNLDNLLENKVSARRQSDHVKPTYYPKRNPSDSLIDWNQDVHVIERFVRAVTRPFNGAYTFVDEQKVVIFDSQVFDLQDFGFGEAAVASVVAIFDEGKFLVKCIGGLLLVNEYFSDTAPQVGTRFGNHTEEIRYFERNSQGFYDIGDN